MPGLLPLVNSGSQTTTEQPLDLSKKDVLTITAVKDGIDSVRKNSSKSNSNVKEDIPITVTPNPDADDIDDVPLVIDEETTDSVDTKLQTPTMDLISKVRIAAT